MESQQNTRAGNPTLLQQKIQFGRAGVYPAPPLVLPKASYDANRRREPPRSRKEQGKNRLLVVFRGMHQHCRARAGDLRQRGPAAASPSPMGITPTQAADCCCSKEIRA